MIMDRPTGNRLVLWHCQAELDMEVRIAAAGYEMPDGQADRHGYALAFIEATHSVYELANGGDEIGQRLARMIAQSGATACS
jgi:hypothetical protein